MICQIGLSKHMVHSVLHTDYKLNSDCVTAEENQKGKKNPKAHLLAEKWTQNKMYIFFRVQLVVIKVNGSFVETFIRLATRKCDSITNNYPTSLCSQKLDRGQTVELSKVEHPLRRATLPQWSSTWLYFASSEALICKRATSLNWWQLFWQQQCLCTAWDCVQMVQHSAQCALVQNTVISCTTTPIFYRWPNTPSQADNQARLVWDKWMFYHS